MGVAVRADRMQQPEPDSFEVLPSNWPAVVAFTALDTQWRVIAGGLGPPVWLGLDYGAVDIVLRRHDIAEPDRVFRDLQVMEREALKVLQE